VKEAIEAIEELQAQSEDGLTADEIKAIRENRLATIAQLEAQIAAAQNDPGDDAA
jgi:hypothetical protein